MASFFFVVAHFTLGSHGLGSRLEKSGISLLGLKSRAGSCKNTVHGHFCCLFLLQRKKKENKKIVQLSFFFFSVALAGVK